MASGGGGNAGGLYGHGMGANAGTAAGYGGRGAPSLHGGPGGPGGIRDYLSRSASGASGSGGCGTAGLSGSFTSREHGVYARDWGGSQYRDAGPCGSHAPGASQSQELSVACERRAHLDGGGCCRGSGGGGTGGASMGSSVGGENAVTPGASRSSHPLVDGNPRVSALVRLNGFLLRTHITSLVSALAEDGWLEAWEKERICRKAREDSQQWALMFLRIYARFVETDDVDSFVAGLRTLIS